jgi:carbon catabolite-derepressing protein kinase
MWRFSFTVRQPRNPISPNAVGPNGNDLEDNPFEADFNEYDEDDIDDGGLDFSIPPPEGNTFAVLNSSLPEQLPEQHHLTSYASAKRSVPATNPRKQHRTRWHFGIRSRSPPMEVMLEIYRTLKALGMEWKEKKDLGGLGGIRRDKDRRSRERAKVERARDQDGGGYVDMKAASSVYFIETRARVQDVVVRLYIPHVPELTPSIPSSRC